MSPDRRTDLDWLRIAAFALLILYHVGMFYVTWDWHVKSSRASDAIEPLMLLTNPWRMTLLFIISGAATRFMADKMPAGALAGSRSWRLLPPLLFGMFVIVPPQSYYEVFEAARAMDMSPGPWLENFYLKYVTASGNWCDADGCLITPTYNHLWFVAYLFVYTLLLIALLPLLRRLPKAPGVLIAGPGLFLTPWLFLWLTRVFMSPIFGETHAIWNDWYLHTTYFAAFVFGFAVAKHAPFFEACMRHRWLVLALALASYAGLMIFYRTAAEPDDLLLTLVRGVRQMQAWAAIIACFGFAYRHLRGADGPLRRYLTDAVFPFYIVHQTAIVVFGHYLDPLALPLGVEATLLLALTLAVCWASFELARRSPFLRPLFGLKGVKPKKGASNIEYAAKASNIE